MEMKNRITFEEWPLDLLMDYILKIHHRGIRKNGPQLLELIGKVRDLHSQNHSYLIELYDLVKESLVDLESHLQKEENVLFPYLYELFEASENKMRMSRMHCGTIRNPIRVMFSEHDNESRRYMYIKTLTNGFTVPEDGCELYGLMMRDLELFINALFEHIYLENEILFSRFQEIEDVWVG